VASNACGKSEAKTKIIRAAKAPDQPAAIQGESLVPLTQTIYQTVAIPGLNYRWNISAGGKILSGQGTASVSVLWEKEGKFELSVEAQNECNFGPKRVLPVTVSVITALEPDPLNDQLTVFPNPSEGKVTLRSPGLDSFELVQVVNSFGQILYESAILSGDTRHDLVDIPRGVHLIRLSGKKGVLSRKLMVK
jgi:hypothetical protein